jgi:hypothetical protein
MRICVNAKLTNCADDAIVFLEVLFMVPTGRINANIDKELYTEVKIHAAKTDQSITAIIERALREYLKNHPTN